MERVPGNRNPFRLYLTMQVVYSFKNNSNVSQGPMTEDYINYPTLIDQAMRGMVRDLLKRVQATGLPGDHHFFISFDTQHPGVKMSDQLKSKYPKDITIVLQHQFWDFKVEELQFSVTLSFGGVPEKLVVPYAALTAFADPSIKFGLQFQAVAVDESFLPVITDGGAEDNMDTEDESKAEIISLDAFRKK